MDALFFGEIGQGSIRYEPLCVDSGEAKMAELCRHLDKGALF